MNTFKMQCINYLLVNGWIQDFDGWEWYHEARGVACDSIGEAIHIQLEWDDEGTN